MSNPIEIKKMHDIIFEELDGDGFQRVVDYFEIKLNYFEPHDYGEYYIQIIDYFNQRYRISPPLLFNQIKHYLFIKKIKGHLKDDVFKEEKLKFIKIQLESTKPIKSLEKDLFKAGLTVETAEKLMEQVGAFMSHCLKKCKI